MKRRIDRVLDNLEKVMGVFGVSLLGMISYLFVNVEKLSFAKICILASGMVAVFVLIIVLVAIYQKYLNKIKE